MIKVNIEFDPIQVEGGSIQVGSTDVRLEVEVDSAREVDVEAVATAGGVNVKVVAGGVDVKVVAGAEGELMSKHVPSSISI